MNDRKKLKKQIDGLMKNYGDKKIDATTYFNKMMNLTKNYKKGK